MGLMNVQSREPSEHGNAPGNHLPGERPNGGHPHSHGKPASWAFVGVIIAAFVAGGFAIVCGIWWLFWACLGVAFAAVPVGKAIDVMGDTVLAGDPSEQPGQDGPVAEDTGSSADPGVDVGPTPAITRGAR
jgi:hypothetical protein